MNQQEQQDRDLTMAIECGLRTLSSDEIRVPTRDIESLMVLKNVFRGLLAGEIILASPDRVLPDGVEIPGPEDKEEGNE